jgi:hypothetical protein
MKGAELAEFLERLEVEHDNLRAALDFCLEQEKGVEAGQRLAGALIQFWEIQGYLSEGRKLLAQVLRQEERSEST